MPEPISPEPLQLKTFIIQQQQVVSAAHNQMKISSVAYYAKKGIYAIVEIFMYLLFVIGIVCTFIIPLDPLSGTTDINATTSVNTTVHNDDVTKIMVAIKVAVFLGSLAFLALGLVFRSLRNKNNLLMSAYKTIDELKKSFDGYTAKWNA